VLGFGKIKQKNVVTFIGVSPGKLDEEPLMFVMKSRRLADGYRKFFEMMWDCCR
jgi:hypothetical protein